MLGATAFVLGVAGLFGSAAMMGAENRSSSAGGCAPQMVRHQQQSTR